MEDKIGTIVIIGLIVAALAFAQWLTSTPDYCKGDPDCHEEMDTGESRANPGGRQPVDYTYLWC